MTTTLTTSGTGRTGRRVAELLTNLDHPIRIGSRSGSHPFDWDDESTWKPALEGCDSAHLAYAPDLAFPGAAELVGRFAVREIGEATGRAIRFEKVPASRFAASLHDAGMPLKEAHSLAELFTEVLDGHNAHQCDGVRRALAREPRGYGDYVRRTAETGVWGG